MENEPIQSLPLFNPLDKRHLGESVISHLLQLPTAPLPPAKVYGAGIYAIYYRGDFELYQVERLEEIPIYVGKAVHAGTRKGLPKQEDADEPPLWDRLKEHAKSIQMAENLTLADFSCRFMAVDDIWIPLAETMLIQRFQPIWNVQIDGFGNHDPGPGRKEQQRSVWDTLHPGRTWAQKLPESASALAILESFKRSRK